MKRSAEHIDRLFQEKLGSYKEDLRPGDWQQMHQMLDARMPVSKPGHFGRFGKGFSGWAVSGVIVAAVTVASLLLLKHPSTHQQAAMPASQKQIVASGTQKNSRESTAQNSTVYIPATVPSGIERQGQGTGNKNSGHEALTARTAIEKHTSNGISSGNLTHTAEITDHRHSGSVRSQLHGRNSSGPDIAINTPHRRSGHGYSNNSLRSGGSQGNLERQLSFNGQRLSDNENLKLETVNRKLETVNSNLTVLSPLDLPHSPFGSQTNGRKPFTIGGRHLFITAGANFGNISTMPGLALGAGLEIPLNERLSLLPGLMYSVRNGKNFSAEQIIVNYNAGLDSSVHRVNTTSCAYLDLPLIARYEAGKRFNLLAGPRLSYLLFTTNELSDYSCRTAPGLGRTSQRHTDQQRFSNYGGIRKLDAGLLLGAELSFSSALKMQLMYDQGFIDLTPDNFYHLNTGNYNSNFRLGLSWTFGR